MSVATPALPDYTTDLGTDYPNNIDSHAKVSSEIAHQFAPHEADPPAMVVVLAPGRLQLGDGTLIEKAEQTSAAIVAPAANPRHDLVVTDDATGDLEIVEGSEAAAPADPAIPAGKTVRGRIRLATDITDITNPIIDDLRPSAPPAPSGEGASTVQQFLGRALTSAWETVDAPSGDFFDGIAWSPELELLVAVGVGEAIYSADGGLTWTAATTPPAGTMQCCRWVSELGLFVAVGSSGRVRTSPDGDVWTARTAVPADVCHYSGIAWSADLGLLVAVSGPSGGSTGVMTSPDGITWTARTPAESNTWRSVAWSPDLQQFVAVANSGTSRVMYSADGINWTATSNGVNATMGWSDVVWVPELGLWVAVAGGGFQDEATMTSPDGVNWTPREGAFVFGTSRMTCNRIVWIPELHMLVGIATGSTVRMMISFDAVEWQRCDAFQNMPTTYPDADWCPKFSRLVLVGTATVGAIAYNAR